MIWTTSTWIVAAVFPVLAVAGVVLAWKHGWRAVVAVLGVALCAAVGHAGFTEVTFPLWEWGAVALGAGIALALRFRTRTLAGFAVIGLLAGAYWGIPVWREAQRKLAVRNGPGCPLDERFAWVYRTSPDSSTAVFAVSAADSGTPDAESHILVGGLNLPRVGRRLESSSLIAGSGEPLLITPDAIARLTETHGRIAETFISGSGFGYRRMMDFTQWPDVELPLACGMSDADRPDDLRSPADRQAAASPGDSSSQSASTASDAHPKSRWVADRLQLVGLLKSRTPRAYEIQGPPAMDELDSVATRPLDEFEQSALARLRSGENLVVAGRGRELRMVGALRADTRCNACHDAKTGVLLGAFTYHFVPGEGEVVAEASAGGP